MFVSEAFLYAALLLLKSLLSEEGSEDATVRQSGLGAAA